MKQILAFLVLLFACACSIPQFERGQEKVVGGLEKVTDGIVAVDKALATINQMVQAALVAARQGGEVAKAADTNKDGKLSTVEIVALLNTLLTTGGLAKVLSIGGQVKTLQGHTDELYDRIPATP